MPLQLPAQIGKYELEQFLGGGMSHVYRARDTVIGRTVAIKILTDEGCADPETKARFLQEARLAGNIAHENVVNIYDYGEDGHGRPYMVMEFLRGEDLRHAMKGGRTGDVQSRLRITLQLARALEYVHSLNITHRDIKPDNVWINPNGSVKLVDFGIAKTAGLSMTRAGFVMGTPYYMAPEQVLGKEVTDLVDIYAFGILLFELISGTKPITAENVERIFYSILNEPLNLEPLRQAGAPEAVVQLVARCTAKDPAQRPQSCAAVAEELEAVLRPAEPAKAPLPVQKPARGMWVVLVVVLVLVLGGGAAYFLTRGKPAGPPQRQLSATLTMASGDMVLVPAGSFLFGPDRRPLTLPDYYIDKTEVSNAAYLAFSNATGHALPSGFRRDRPDLPVVNLTIVDAGQFARWAGKRLPNAREWEKAARGAQGWAFPWGNQSDPSRANLADNTALPRHELMPVNGFDNGASPFRALQMVGNAWEFVNEPGNPSAEVLARFARLLTPPPAASEPWYTIRGESYQEPLAPEVMYDFSTVPARWASDTIGFRCAKDP